MDLVYLSQLLITGITEGSIYVLVALGTVIIYKCTRVVNLAQGEFVVLGGMLMATLTGVGLPIPLAFVLTLIIVALAGGLVAILGFRPYLKRNIPFGTIVVVTIGIHMFLKMAIMLIWGKLPISVPAFSGGIILEFYGVYINPQSIWVIALTGLTLVAAIYFLEKTLLGKAFRACAENRFSARLFGINDDKMLLIALMLSGVLGAVGGATIAPISYIKYDFGMMYSVNGFIAAVIGGLDKPMGAVVGGLMIGLISSFGAGLFGAGARDILVLATLLIILVLRPTGIYAGKAGG
ncbi:MAG: branched-chain amino acid ABC transporter permease [Clostridia bacterium]|nr:branched-chain amino acid ABC transporter permease [Clostridia bacterium]